MLCMAPAARKAVRFYTWLNERQYEANSILRSKGQGSSDKEVDQIRCQLTFEVRLQEETWHSQGCSKEGAYHPRNVLVLVGFLESVKFT